MPQHLCPKCNHQLKPNARFCSYCGVKLETITPQRGLKIKPKPDMSSPVQKSKTDVEPITPSIEAAFIMRGKLEKLKSQKIIVEEELETIRIKHLVGELTEDEVKTQQETLQDRMAQITKEINDISSKANTPLENFQQEKNAQEERIHRLKELHKSGEVNDAVFQRLNDEYQRKLSELEKQLDSELRKAHHWLRQLEAQKEQLEFERETLQVRAKIDEISKREVNKQLSTLEQQITTIVLVLDGLHAVLGFQTQHMEEEKTIYPSRLTEKQRKPPTNQCPHCGAKTTPDSKYCYTCGRLIAD